MRLEHWMMFSTFAEQDYFVYPQHEVYTGVIINANMASHAPAGLASFIIGKLHPNTKYIVDPITHAFQHDPSFIRNEKGDPKASIRVLAQMYGVPISEFVGVKPLQPDHLPNEHIPGFTGRVLNFQRSHLHNQMESSDASKYLEKDEIKKPHALIPPYFCLTETNLYGWLEKNIKCVESALSLLSVGEDLFAEIVVDRGVLLDEKMRREILEGYKNFEERLAGCLIWVDNLDELKVPIAELRALKDFCTDLKSFMPTIINLHGGYFSILLGSEAGGNCLTGVTHGPEFGEFRSVVPVGGGIPIARYYIPRLHARVRFREAAELFSSAGWLDSYDRFLGTVCDCDECKNTLSGNIENFTMFGEGEVKEIRRRRGMTRIEFPSSATKLRCLKHYLQRKDREYKMVCSLPSKEIIEELDDSISVYGQYVGDSGVSHLRRWKTALS